MIKYKYLYSPTSLRRLVVGLMAARRQNSEKKRAFPQRSLIIVAANLGVFHNAAVMQLPGAIGRLLLLQKDCLVVRRKKAVLDLEFEHV